MAAASPEELEPILRPTGFYRNKAKSVVGASRGIVERFGGIVPDEMDKLLTLPGVARKTANVVLGSWFRKAVGVVVDTQLHGIARAQPGQPDEHDEDGVADDERGKGIQQRRIQCHQTSSATILRMKMKAMPTSRNAVKKMSCPHSALNDWLM